MTAPSNGPWILVDIDFRDACDHFSKGVGIFGEGDRFERPDMAGYEAKMALSNQRAPKARCPRRPSGD